jgi:hypothetical protein
VQCVPNAILGALMTFIGFCHSYFTLHRGCVSPVILTELSRVNLQDVAGFENLKYVE